MVRKILAGIAGIITTFAVITLVQLASHVMYPPPADLDFGNEVALAAWIGELPVGAFLMVLLSYFTGAFCGAFVGGWIAGSGGRLYAVIVGVLVVAGTIYNVATIPHPIWFTVVALIGIPAAAFLGGNLAPTRKYG